MISILFKYFRSIFAVPETDIDKKEFEINIDKINVPRAIITSVAFIVMELIQLLVFLLSRNGDLSIHNDKFYITMYIIMMIVMAVFLNIFIQLDTDIANNTRKIKFAGYAFIEFVLLWCAIISLLDQLSFGQIIVYTVAIIAIAVTPITKPVTLLFLYLPVQILFIFFMINLQKSDLVSFGNCANSTAFIAISWFIACMRYRNRIEDFKNKKIIQEKSDELQKLNMDLAEANKKLEKLSQTDGLTGIYNRFVFDKAIRSEWERCKRYCVPLALIMIDIDSFKAYNDAYGHPAGDECIKRVAGVLSDCARRSSDVVTRYGGEEFAVVLPYMNKENASLVAEKMRRGVEELHIRQSNTVTSEYITISLGVYAVIPSNQLSVEKFIGIADKALYEAKNVRRNKIVAAE